MKTMWLTKTFWLDLANTQRREIGWQMICTFVENIVARARSPGVNRKKKDDDDEEDC